MKLKILLSTNDKELTIPITSRVNPLGYDDNVQSIVDAETNNSINPVTDAEVRRVKISQTYNFTFSFWNGFSYVNDVAPLEFNPTTDANTPAVISSFYVVQLYDQYQEEIQTKRHTGYYNGYDFGVSNLVSQYSLNNSNEFTDLYLPQWYLDSMSGLSTTCYVKFLFYSAKSGKFYPFYNATAGDTNQKKLYHTVVINPNTLTYSFVGVGSTVSLKELTNSAYSTLVNNTVPSFPIEKTTYPTGNTFTSGGQYVNQ